MFTKRIYKCVCHVCGDYFDHESEFFSTGASKDCLDGINRAVITCNVSFPNKHPQEEIQDSFNRQYGHY